PELSSQATITIKVSDVNDNSPQCPAVNTFAVSDDNEVGVTFDNVIATDPDEGLNSSLIYRLQVEDVNFALRNNGELIVKKKLSDKGNRRESRLSVVVLDQNGGPQARATTCSIQILVIKVKSKVKFLEPVDRIVRIDNKCSTGCLLKSLNATNVAKWEIELSDISNNFEILNNTLQTSQHFNASMISDGRTLTVAALDNDERKKQITFIIRTSVLPELNHSNKTIIVRTSRVLPIGSQVITLSKNESKGTFWHLKNTTDAFHLDSKTSILYLTANLRQTHASSYFLEILEWIPPNYSYSKQHNVYIEIEPTNLYWPKFSNCPRFFTVKENEQTGSVIGEVKAEETDATSDVHLSYSIIQDSSGSFSIDSHSAELLLTRSLHDQQGQLLSFLIVEAEDNFPDIKKRKRSNCVVFISIEDINDHQPKFLSSNNVTINDNFVDGDIIHYVVAVDADFGDNGRITYTLSEETSNSIFKIDPKSGALQLLHRFNGEKHLRVRASDNGNPPKYAEVNLSVKFDSRHRRWKFFQQQEYNFYVNDTTASETILHDFSRNKKNWQYLQLFPYFISENDPLQLSESGKLLLQKGVTSGKYTYLLIASKSQRLIDWTWIKLTVTSDNKYPPRISSSSCGNLTIRENIATEHLTRIYAWDQDDSADSTIFYRIIAGNEKSVFYLNSSTGLLSCHELDRERQSEYFLVITAEDQGLLKRADTCTLRVLVTDENDNVPIFNENTPKFIEINDNIEVGDILTELTAKDDDANSNGKVTYSITDDSSGLLDIRPDSGEIIFARNYPLPNGKYIVKIKAEDHGNSRVLSSERDIDLFVKRFKFHEQSMEPQFLSEQYVGFINEGEPRGQFALQVRSWNSLPEDSPLAYSIVSGNMDSAFGIDEEGRIITAQELDYEINNNYNLKVIQMSSNFKNTPETDVFIRGQKIFYLLNFRHIVNRNDNIPSFPVLKPFTVSESANYGTLVATVSAKDVDVDTQLEYSLLSCDHLFEIDPFSGKVFLIGKLDYEIEKEHNIEIQVTDGENVSRTTLRILVKDANDNEPKFEEDFYLIHVSSDIQLNSIIAKIHADDPDTGLAGSVQYGLLPNSSSKFKIDHESGDLIVVEKLTDQSVYHLTILASDQGEPPLSSVCLARIDVGGEEFSRKPIRFTNKSFNFAIPENTHPHVGFGKLTLIDIASTSVTLKIQPPEVANIFGILNDGSIFLKQAISASLQNEFEFEVEALSPLASANSSAKVSINVMDHNDNVPYFIEKVDQIIIDKKMNTNDVLTKFVAGDNDKGDNARISYQILSGNDYGMFHLNSSSGELYLTKTIGDEEILSNATFSDLILTASDNGNPSKWNWTTVSVKLHVDYTSIKSPFFIVSQYEIHVFEDTPKGSIILRSKAVNKLGIHGDNWTYALKDNDESFGCNKSSGYIMLMKRLDFELQQRYEFILSVVDDQDRSAFASVKVIVHGVDEYPPVFMKRDYVLQIPKNSQVGQRVGIISALDQDFGVGGKIRYEIQGNAAKYLSIDADTGQVALSREIDFGIINSNNITYDELVVIASSSQTQSTRTKVLIQVYSVSKGNISVIRDLSQRSPKFECQRQFALSSSSFSDRSKVIHFCFHSKYKVLYQNLDNSSYLISYLFTFKQNLTFYFMQNLPASNTNFGYCATKLLSKRPLESQTVHHSIPHSMPDSGIDLDDLSATSSVTEYLNQIGVTPNKYFDSNESSNKERVTGYLEAINNDSEINDLIYAKVDEILSPASQMNVSLSSDSSIDISSFTVSTNCFFIY
ncbi:unnamed protein product, partial [Thelazia callipaeda]|uniref:Cadherin n=1 Tax=Thelazia callipaeda TaxID=103827 RepID=A0A0N5D4X6_THECL